VSSESNKPTVSTYHYSFENCGDAGLN